MGLGEPKHALHYCGSLAPSLQCLVSETNNPYYSFGFHRGTNAEAFTNAFNIAKATAKAFRNGHVQGQTTGDIQLLGGTFIVDRTGIVRYAYYNRYAGDDPEIGDLIALGHQLGSSRK